MYGSMALLADGWHMATHVAAFTVTLAAYRYARAHVDDPRFSFGTGKVTTLAGFASAVGLAVVALLMAVESTVRLFQPHAIHFDEALVVATLGLVVNLVCGYLLLQGTHPHDEPAGTAAGHAHGPAHDHNLRAALLHVLADALTSVLAITALLAGKFAGLTWLDPVIGWFGAAVIARWSWSLMRTTGHILLDGTADAGIRAAITAAIEGDADNRVADLHVGSRRRTLCRRDQSRHASAARAGTLQGIAPPPAPARARAGGSERLPGPPARTLTRRPRVFKPRRAVYTAPAGCLNLLE